MADILENIHFVFTAKLKTTSLQDEDGNLFIFMAGIFGITIVCYTLCYV